jgi:phenylpyruvate tautomerase PptA (4-oxalocrotonate tautomerase family)
MKEYDVTIQAVVTKTIRVKAEDEAEAYEFASGLFSVTSDKHDEDYEQDALNIAEVDEDDWFLSGKSYEEYYDDQNQ